MTNSQGYSHIHRLLCSWGVCPKVPVDMKEYEPAQGFFPESYLYGGLSFPNYLLTPQVKLIFRIHLKLMSHSMVFFPQEKKNAKCLVLNKIFHMWNDNKRPTNLCWDVLKLWSSHAVKVARFTKDDKCTVKFEYQANSSLPVIWACSMQYSGNTYRKVYLLYLGN